MRIGIDLMGGDHPPSVLFEAVEQAAARFPTVNLTVFVTQTALHSILSSSPSCLNQRQAHLEFQIVSDVIEMHEEPLVAIREKKSSSLALGIKMLRKKQLDGFVTVGNTGALIAGAALSLSLLPTIKRPALLAVLPTEKEHVVIMDVGGNVSCKAHHLVQFAQLSVAYQRAWRNLEQPRVGLLNIGTESKKGTSEVRQAHQLLRECHERGEICFVGNVEGRDVFQGIVDVLVTDGFTGNVFLKACEGISFFILNQLHRNLKETLGDTSDEFFHHLYQQVNYEEYRGAILCGVDGVAIKCHGQSSAKGLFNGIQGAIELVQKDFISQIKQQLANSAL